MSKSSLFWLLLGLWFILGWWLCKNYICGASDVSDATPAIIPAAVSSVCDASLDINDGSTFGIKDDTNIRFTGSSFQHLPFSSSITSALERTANYLKENVNRSLTITGRYLDSESYDGLLPNLGMARATNIKAYFESLGVPAKQLVVAGAQDNDLCVRKAISITGDSTGNAGNLANTAIVKYGGGAFSNLDTLCNGLSFNFGDAGTNDSRLEEIRTRLLGKPITLYFETNATNLILTSKQKQDFADLSFYLDNVKDASLSVEGHTDNKGTATINRRLSRGRANFARDYLTEKLSIDSARFTAQGFGPSKPVATNETVEGRALNRRVEVILK